jgi:hypothetical protein
MKARIIAFATVLAVSVPASASGQGPRVRTEERRPVVVQVSGGGFRWGDAAIGAAAASGATLVVAGLGMFRRQVKREES